MSYPAAIRRLWSRWNTIASASTTDHFAPSCYEHWNFPSLYVDIAAQSGIFAIDSPHKNAILIFLISSILAAQFGYGNLREDVELLLQELLSRSNVGADTIAYYTETFSLTLREQDLVRYTLEMFAVKVAI